MSIYISGSLAYDRIMTFKGNFHDHILADKLRVLNVSFMIDYMEERRGGCAGNIAYSLALLGQKPLIIAQVGRDFAPYAKALKELGLSTDGIHTYNDVFTAQGFITTDLNSNQITGFYPGAMARKSDYTFQNLNPSTDLAIVSPGNMDDMRNFTSLYKEKGVRYIYDPGQQLPMLTAKDLLAAIEGSFALITNDYELNLICNTTQLTPNDLLGRTLWIVTTHGSKGSVVLGADGSEIHIDPTYVENVADPTGAGDAHRSGLLFGLSHGLDFPTCAKLGSVTASFAVEKMGTQEHHFTKADIKARYLATFHNFPTELEAWVNS
ncbi:MAG: carbohydrate kinase family protein [Desulfovibrionaceae bacterium]|nr:carbohydrate kinase family protein [Desulfovibrionaceae bacterium]